MRDRRGSHGLFPKHKLALPPRMMELDEDPGAILMHRIHESFETLEVTAMAGGQLVRLTHSGAVEDAAQTTDDKSDPTLRPRLVKGNGIVIDAPPAAARLRPMAVMATRFLISRRPIWTGLNRLSYMGWLHSLSCHQDR